MICLECGQRYRIYCPYCFGCGLDLQPITTRIRHLSRLAAGNSRGVGLKHFHSRPARHWKSNHLHAGQHLGEGLVHAPMYALSELESAA